MTPDERAQLDAYAIRFGMDSIDVDEALARVGGDAATLHMARAAVTAYALRRDLVAGRESRAIIPAARAVIAAWRAPAESADEHMRRLAEALANLERALQGSYEVEEVPEE
jgi:ubiquinone biosynthesis protein UbiJ